jgi:hypothetical protein
MTEAPDAPTDPPQIGIRLVVAHDDTTRRVDLQLVGSRGVAVEDGLATTFEAERLWPTVRNVLPEIEHLRADPHGLPSPDPERAPGEGWDQQCRAMVSVAVASLPGGEVALRTWFATDTELWSATPLPDGHTDLRLAAPGAVADLLIWDVTGALEVLVAEVAS